MEKKEMSFIEKFAAASKELEKAMVESNKDVMIMIAASEGIDDISVSASIKGKTCEIETLFACFAIKNKDFKTILTNVIKFVEAWEQGSLGTRNKLILWKRKK